MTTGLFGQSVVEPMPSKQIPLFHEPVTVAAPPLPGTTAADRRIGRRFDAEATPMLAARRKSPATLPVPKPRTEAVNRGHFGWHDDNRPVRPSPAEVRAITGYHAEKLAAILGWPDKEARHFAYQAALRMYSGDFGAGAANRLDSYVRRQVEQNH